MLARDCKIGKILFLIIGIILPSLIFFTPPTSITAQDTNQTVSINTIFDNIDKYFNDTTYGGYYSQINTNGQVVNNAKYVYDYMYALGVISKLVKNFNETSYLKDIPVFLNLINKFKTNVYGYFISETRYFSSMGDRIYASTMALMLSTYVKLYSSTVNPIFLTDAINTYNFIQKYFYDPVNGGYYSELLPTGLIVGSSVKNTESYGLLAQSFLDLYTITKDISILLNGYNLLITTIATAFNSTYNYFIPYLEKDSSVIYTFNNYIFDVTQQLTIAEALLAYSNTNLPIDLTNNYKSEFISKADKIYTNIRNNLLNNSYIMTNYNVQSNKINSGIDVGIQSQFIEFLLLRKKSDPNFNQLDQNMLDQASDMFSGFLSPKLNLFIRSEHYQYTGPLVNYEILNIILDLKINKISAPIYTQTNSAPVFQHNPKVHNYYGDNNQSLAILLVIFSVTGIGLAVIIFVRMRIGKRKSSFLTSKSDKKTSKESQKLKNEITTLKEVHQSAELKICFNCKKEVLDQDIVCHYCGTKLKQ